MGRTLGSGGYATVINQDIYEISDTQKHRLGTAVKRGDCIYKYAKTTATMTKTSLLMASTYHQDIMYAAIPTANAIGDNEIHVTVGAADGIANDGVFAVHAMEGGKLVVFYAPAVLSNGVVANFGILDNTAAVSGGDMTVTLDGELPRATVVGTSIIEAMGNPYLVTNANTAGVRAFMGLPMRVATTTEPYLWLQTWGPAWMAPQSDVGASANCSQVVARHDGSIQLQDVYMSSTTPTSGEKVNGINAQNIGYVMNYSQAGGQGAPFIMLQISV